MGLTPLPPLSTARGGARAACTLAKVVLSQTGVVTTRWIQSGFWERILIHAYGQCTLPTMLGMLGAGPQ